MKHRLVLCCIALSLISLGQSTSSAANKNSWSSFRNGGLSTTVGKYPVEWSPESGVTWQTETAGYGQSSPIT